MHRFELKWQITVQLCGKTFCRISVKETKCRILFNKGLNQIYINGIQQVEYWVQKTVTMSQWTQCPGTVLLCLKPLKQHLKMAACNRFSFSTTACSNKVSTIKFFIHSHGPMLGLVRGYIQKHGIKWFCMVGMVQFKDNIILRGIDFYKKYHHIQKSNKYEITTWKKIE